VAEREVGLTEYRATKSVSYKTGSIEITEYEHSPKRVKDPLN